MQFFPTLFIRGDKDHYHRDMTLLSTAKAALLAIYFPLYILAIVIQSWLIRLTLGKEKHYMYNEGIFRAHNEIITNWVEFDDKDASCEPRDYGSDGVNQLKSSDEQENNIEAELK